MSIIIQPLKDREIHIKERMKYNFILSEWGSRGKASMIHIGNENMKIYSIWGRKNGNIYGKKIQFLILKISILRNLSIIENKSTTLAHKNKSTHLYEKKVCQ